MHIYLIEDHLTTLGIFSQTDPATCCNILQQTFNKTLGKIENPLLKLFFPPSILL